MSNTPLLRIALQPLLAATTVAQSRLVPQPITASVKHRGTFHTATGTWSREMPASPAGPLAVAATSSAAARPPARPGPA